jgi:hypothetical protein
LATLNASFSWATKVQPLLLDTAPSVGAAAVGAGAGAVADGAVASTALALLPPLPPPQPANKTATEQKSKCTGFN